MLVTIVVLFLVTELPQGALALCSGLTQHCFQAYYAPLGDTMDIVALIDNNTAASDVIARCDDVTRTMR